MHAFEAHANTDRNAYSSPSPLLTFLRSLPIVVVVILILLAIVSITADVSIVVNMIIVVNASSWSSSASRLLPWSLEVAVAEAAVVGAGVRRSRSRR